MLPVLSALTTPDHVKYYDMEKAPNSLAVHEKGNVYGIDAKGKYVFDDTNTFKIKDAAKTTYGGLKSDKGDHVKLARIAEQQPKVAYIKLTMFSFQTKEFRNRVKDILYPNDVPKFKYARAFKFGKLHNDEFYIVLSNIESLPLQNWGVLVGDLRAISASMVMANQIIQLAERAGLRLCSPEIESEATTTRLWEALVRSVPANWGWYLDLPTIDQPYTDGNELVGMVNIDTINEFEEATYADFDDEGKPSWEKGYGLDDDDLKGSPFDSKPLSSWAASILDQPPAPTQTSVGSDLLPQDRPNFSKTLVDLYPDQHGPLADPRPPPKFDELAKPKGEKPKPRKQANKPSPQPKSSKRTR